MSLGNKFSCLIIGEENNAPLKKPLSQKINVSYVSKWGVQDEINGNLWGGSFIYHYKT